MKAAELNRIVRRGMRRADELEPRLAALLEPVLARAGATAARNFVQRAGSMTAAAPPAAVWPVVAGGIERFPLELRPVLEMIVTRRAQGLTAATAPPPWRPPSSSELLDLDALVAELRTKTDPVRLALIASMMDAQLGPLGINWNVTNQYIAKALAVTGLQVTNVADTTRLNVMRIIRRSYEEGLSIPDTAKLLRAGMREASRERALLIARTELVGAVNGGSLAATKIVSKATGDKFWKVWLTAPGAKHPRHHHYDNLNGQTRDLDGYFDVGGYQLEHPGDPNGPPGEVCRCRCAVNYTDEAPVAF